MVRNMETEYRVTRKVQEISGSYAVYLPKIWCRRYGIRKGKPLIIAFDHFEFLKIYPTKNEEESWEGQEVERKSTRRDSDVNDRQHAGETNN